MADRCKKLVVFVCQVAFAVFKLKLKTLNMQAKQSKAKQSKVSIVMQNNEVNMYKIYMVFLQKTELNMARPIS